MLWSVNCAKKAKKWIPKLQTDKASWAQIRHDIIGWVEWWWQWLLTGNGDMAELRQGERKTRDAFAMCAGMSSLWWLWNFRVWPVLGMQPWSSRWSLWLPGLSTEQWWRHWKLEKKVAKKRNTAVDEEGDWKLERKYNFWKKYHQWIVGPLGIHQCC